MVSLQNPYGIVRHYPEQNYYTFFNQKTGFFARVEDCGCEEPFWSWHGPELLDISITNWCDRECPICYRKSNTNGKHMSVTDYEVIMQQASRMHVFQVALGGGNPNQHPDFREIIRWTREKYGIVPSYTTNGRGLTNKILEASRKYCGAVAVSAYPPYEEMKHAIELLTSYGIRTNIHFVLDYSSLETAIRWLENPPKYFGLLNAIVFLNYKPVGRGSNYNLLLKHSDKLERFFRLVTTCEHKFKIGFDSCMVSGLVRFTHVPAICYDGCEAGRFSMFISEDMKMYPCSFMAIDKDGIPIVKNNMLEVWQKSRLFWQIRDRLANNHCKGCSYSKLCLGSCPVFQEINLCSGMR
jgi:radical SAM protein with 4Fe4S-binding SPASM domain